MSDLFFERLICLSYAQSVKNWGQINYIYNLEVVFTVPVMQLLYFAILLIVFGLHTQTKGTELVTGVVPFQRELICTCKVLICTNKYVLLFSFCRVLPQWQLFIFFSESV